MFIPISDVRECYCLSWDLLGINIKHSLSIADTELIGYQNLTNIKYMAFLSKAILVQFWV